jgi:hypothetical protein
LLYFERKKSEKNTKNRHIFKNRKIFINLGAFFAPLVRIAHDHRVPMRIKTRVREVSAVSGSWVFPFNPHNLRLLLTKRRKFIIIEKSWYSWA